MPAPARRAFLHTLVAAALAGMALPGAALPPQPRLVAVDVYDRTSGAALPVHVHDGRSYVVGAPGHAYAVRIRNCTGARVLAVTSVDGVNVVSGETAAPDQAGYVIEPWGSVEITGWRKSLQRIAAFTFADQAQSYAARTGRPFDIGVIGVAAFAEARPPQQRIAEGKREGRAQPSSEAAGAGAAEALRDRAEAMPARPAPVQPMAKLGTGHGRSEASPARQVTFERASDAPAQVVALLYDRYENLLAQGVIVEPPRVARLPRPFPGLRFAPDPH